MVKETGLGERGTEGGYDSCCDQGCIYACAKELGVIGAELCHVIINCKKDDGINSYQY